MHHWAVKDWHRESRSSAFGGDIFITDNGIIRALKKIVALFYDDNYELKIEEIADNNKWQVNTAVVAQEKLWTKVFSGDYRLGLLCNNTLYVPHADGIVYTYRVYTSED